MNIYLQKIAKLNKINNIKFLQSEYNNKIIKYFSTNTKKLTFYEVLELRKTCSQKEIKQQFLKLAKLYHPDVYKGSDTDRFKQIKEAYETLKKPVLRKKYDQSLNQNSMNDKAYEDFDQNSAESGEQKESQYEGKPGSFNYESMKNKSQEDLQKEYENFFKEPINIKPEEVVTHQDVFERQLGFEERVRYEYSFIRNNLDLYNLKHLHQQSYEETVNDTINMINAKNIPDDVLKAKEKAEIKKYDRYKKIAFAIFLAFSLPFFISHTQRKKQIKDHLDKDSRDYLEQEEERDLYDLHDRIKFDHRHEELQKQSE